jgi:Arc/MetJ-type ribon-helix-helix transcriptional regulator
MRLDRGWGLVYSRLMNTSRNTSERIVKVPLPSGLIKRMDEGLTRQRGGFSTRAELIREAVENLLNELEYPEADPEPARTRFEDRADVAAPERRDPARAETTGMRGAAAALGEIVDGLPDWERSELTLADLAGTRLKMPGFTPVLVSSDGLRVADEPMLGLHNRDYPSLWAAMRLARYSESGLPPFPSFLDRVTKAAWFFGYELQQLSADGAGGKLAVLFPTNTGKQPSAERGFQNFGVGVVGRDQSTEPNASGPLFAWGVIAVDASGAVGLTPAGWDLLGRIEGVSLQMPHAQDHLMVFLEHLAAHSPADRWGFDHLVAAVAAGPDRVSLLASFAEAHPEWTQAMVSSVAQGYVARAREWGLVEPKLVEGRYWLTDLGRSFGRGLSQVHKSQEPKRESS